MLYVICLWALIIIAVEAVTEIISSSQIFFGLRDWIGVKANVDSDKPTFIEKVFGFVSYLINCGYCISVWVAIAAIVLPPVFECWYIDIPVKIFVVHRLSNVFHELVKKWLDRRPFVLVIHKPGEKNEKERN